MYFAWSCGLGMIAVICFSILLFGHKIVNEREHMEEALRDSVVFLTVVGSIASSLSFGLITYIMFG